MNAEINELKTLNNQGVNYKGIVKVSIVNGQNKTISTNTYHNNGTNNLFNFIANCIAGNYINHEKYRPCKIALYKAAESGSNIKSACRVSNFIFQDGAAKVKNISSGIASGCEVIYHFRIPFVQLTSGANVVSAALWPSIFSENNNEYSAAVNFNPEIEIPANVSTNWTIIVDWTLQISNAPSSTSTTPTV